MIQRPLPSDSLFDHFVYVLVIELDCSQSDDSTSLIAILSVEIIPKSAIRAQLSRFPGWFGKIRDIVELMSPRSYQHCRAVEEERFDNQKVGQASEPGTCRWDFSWDN
jgi:hypothetical protein